MFLLYVVCYFVFINEDSLFYYLKLINSWIVLKNAILNSSHHIMFDFIVRFKFKLNQFYSFILIVLL